MVTTTPLEAARAELERQAEENGAFIGPPDKHDPLWCLDGRFDLAALVDAVLAGQWWDMETVPMGEPVLVFLERPVQGTRIHAAYFNKNISVIGGLFAFDMPKALKWCRQPKEPAT